MRLFSIFMMFMVLFSCDDSDVIKETQNTLKQKDIGDLQQNTNIREPNDSIERTIIFVLYEGEEYGLNEKIVLAVPLVLFENGEYIDPPSCYDDYDLDGRYYSKDELREFKRVCEITKEKFAPIVEKGKKLFLLTNGIKTAEIIIKNKIDYGLSDATRPSALIEKSIYDGRLLTNNGNLGTKMIVIPDDMPKLPKRIDDGGFGAFLEEEETDTQVRYYDDNLIGVVDINLDGTPELIYECQYLYGQYYRIYSKLDNHWKMLFEGAYNGF
jgi:hypothetical protein